MTTLNREEIIEAMARAIYGAEHQQMKERNGRNNAWVDSFTYDDENHGFRRMELREKAKAALDALLERLPTNSYFALANGAVECDKEDAEFYKQLLSLRRK